MFPTIPTSALRPWSRCPAANICLPGDGLALEQDAEAARNITLNKGVNVVVFKIFNEEGSDWQACLRFTDTGGKAVSNLFIRLEP